jgi:hypothetical protein
MTKTRENWKKRKKGKEKEKALHKKETPSPTLPSVKKTE